MYDIVFISYNEPKSHIRFLDLLKKVALLPNNLIRINGIEGIHQAHIEAAKQVKTKMFYVVDADAIIVAEFDFDIELDPSEEDIVHVWRSRNPVNNLEYGYGGVKLLPTELTKNMDVTNTDMTTSISKRFKIVDKVSNITAFNIDPLCTWRSAFRECVKLSSKIIPGQLNEETENRLNEWRFNTNSELYAEYARGGASAGHWYGTTYQNDPLALKKINDYAWLKEQFEAHIKMFPPETFK